MAPAQGGHAQIEKCKQFFANSLTARKVALGCPPPFHQCVVAAAFAKALQTALRASREGTTEPNMSTQSRT